jgi:hypothetical protein
MLRPALAAGATFDDVDDVAGDERIVLARPLAAPPTRGGRLGNGSCVAVLACVIVAAPRMLRAAIP